MKVWGGCLGKYWAEITDDRVVFYSEDWLAEQNPILLQQLEEKRKHHVKYQQPVSICDNQKEILQEEGVKVLRPKFLALEGKWHWFTGYSKMDAFRLNSEVEQIVREKPFVVKIKEKAEDRQKSVYDMINISEFVPKETLFIVSCSAKKIWQYDPSAPDFVPAKYAYRGRKFLKFLKWAEEKNIECKGFSWMILSGKYGFIEPWHPISRYDVKLGCKKYHPISDETLKNQVWQKRWWRNPGGQLNEIRLVEFKNIVAINCNEKYLCRIKKCFPNAKIKSISFPEEDEDPPQTPAETSSDFTAYIQRLQDPIFLLEGCRIFYENYEDYLDELAESIWQIFFKGGDMPPERLILGAAETILIKWNAPYLFQESPHELISILINNSISKELTEAYKSTKTQITRLFNVSLGDPNLNEHIDLIKQVYREFQKKPTIRMVGATKALHFIHPSLFVPWDTKIRESYHKYDPDHEKSHEIGSPECYADFIKTCNSITTKLLEKLPKNNLFQKHPIYEELGHIRTIPKMIDECNFCWFTKNERWDLPF